MATPMKKRRKAKSEETSKKSTSDEHGDTETPGLNLDDIKDLGGDEEDLKMLQDLTDDDEFEDAVDNDDQDVDEKAIRKFIKSLGFQSDQSEVIGNKKEPSAKTSKDTKSKLAAETPDKTKKEKKKTKETKSKKTLVQHPEVSSSTIVDDKDEQKKTYLVQPGGKWYENEFSSDPIVSTSQDADTVKKYQQKAVKLFQDETALYSEKKSGESSSSGSWMQTVLTSGTLGDKMAALTVMIQDSSVHSFGRLETLIAMTKKKGKREAIMAMETLKDLWLSQLLPENRKLRVFSQHPFDQLDNLSGGSKSRNKRLLLWYFEDQLKKKYEEYLQAVKVLSHDTVSAVKTKAISTVYHLLVNTPEQEKFLLTELVNKVGDPDRKIAAKVSHLLGKMVEIHPQMKVIVASEVERMLYRPNVGAKAQYYGICYLNQFVLSHDEPELAARLITIYFSFFRAFAKKKEVDGKMLSALLTGVNRAYPYAKVNDDSINEQMDTIFRVIHIAPFNTGVQALMLLYQVMDARQAMSDRFYMALYKKLTDPELKNSPRQPMFLNLLFKSLKADVVFKRIKAFIKRLLQICSCHQPTFICGALYLISEIFRSRHETRSLIHVANNLGDDDDEEEQFKDINTESDQDDDDEERKLDKNTSEKSVTSSWVHHKLNKDSDKKLRYDALSRNPLYCGAETSILWELQKLGDHYHPSVAHFARTILDEKFIQYSGDPLQDFTLIKFLDRFVYRNPKNVHKEKSSVMEPKSKSYHPPGIGSLPVNSEAFVKKAEEEIPLDQVFFHRYFSKREEEKKKKDGYLEDLDSDASSVEDDDFDSYLHKLERGEVDIDDDIDFAGEFSRRKEKKKSKSQDEESDDSEDLEDPDIDDDSDFDFGDFDDDDDELGEENFGGEDTEDFEVNQSKTSGKDGSLAATATSKRKRKRGKKEKRSVQDVQATAEEFGTMMDENIGSKFDNIGVNAMANKDKADVKQLKWEVARDRWVRDADFKSIKSKGKNRKNVKSQGKFRQKGGSRKKFKR